MKPILNIVIPKFFGTNREYYMNYVKKIIQNDELTNDYHIIVTQRAGVNVAKLEVVGLNDKNMSKREKRNFALKK